MRNYRVKPSKPSSVIAAAVGIVFVILGVTTIIPRMGFIGFFWTLIALAITGYHLYNLFSSKGTGIYEIDIKEKTTERLGFDQQLRKLKSLYDDGIITKVDYEEKKADILKSKW